MSELPGARSAVWPLVTLRPAPKGSCYFALLTIVVLAGASVPACASADPDALGPFPAAQEEDDPHGDESGSSPANADPNIGSEGVEPESESEPAVDASTPAPTPTDAGRPSDGGRDAAADASTAPQRAASPVPGKIVTYPYGVKNSRYAAGYHTGEDYAAPTGTNVVAVRNGVVRWSNDSGGAYGRWMGVQADNGRVYVYCHLSVRNVAAGATVKANQVIGKVGATGNVTGPHLHFEDHPTGPFTYARGRKPAW